MSHFRRIDYVEGQTDFLADLPLYTVLASMAPAYRDTAKTLSQLQKSVLAKAKTRTCIYVLEDPRNGHVRYVGRTRSPQARYSCHCGKTDASVGMSVWVEELRAQNWRPYFHVIEVVECNQVVAREYFWIRFFSKHFRLLNTMYARGRSSLSATDHTIPLFARKK